MKRLGVLACLILFVICFGWAAIRLLAGDYFTYLLVSIAAISTFNAGYLAGLLDREG